jgi:hypothetical protein
MYTLNEHSEHYCIVMYKCMFLWVFYVQALLWQVKLPGDPLPLGNWLWATHSSSGPLRLPRAWRKLHVVSCKGKAGGSSCFSIAGAKLNFICFFLLKNKHYLLGEKKWHNQVAGDHGAHFKDYHGKETSLANGVWSFEQTRSIFLVGETLVASLFSPWCLLVVIGREGPSHCRCSTGAVFW